MDLVLTTTIWRYTWRVYHIAYLHASALCRHNSSHLHFSVICCCRVSMTSLSSLALAACSFRHFSTTFAWSLSSCMPWKSPTTMRAMHHQSYFIQNSSTWDFFCPAQAPNPFRQKISYKGGWSVTWLSRKTTDKSRETSSSKLTGSDCNVFSEKGQGTSLLVCACGKGEGISQVIPRKTHRFPKGGLHRYWGMAED